MTNVFVGACTYRHQVIPPAQTLGVTAEKTKQPSSWQKLWGKRTLRGVICHNWLSDMHKNEILHLIWVQVGVGMEGVCERSC